MCWRAFWSVAFGLVAVAGRCADPISMEDLIREYKADAHSIASCFDLDWAEPVLDRHRHLVASWHSRLAEVPFSELSKKDRVDYLLLRNHLDREREALEIQSRRIAEIDSLIPFRTAIAKLEMARWRGQKTNPPEAAARIEKIGELAKEFKEQIQKPAGGEKGEAKRETGEGKGGEKGADKGKNKIEVEAGLALRAAAAVDGLRSGLKRWFEFYNGYEPEFSWWVRSSYNDASAKLEAYGKFLREEIAGQKGKDDDPLVGVAVGADTVRRQLALEFIAYGPEEVIEIGERELAWCETEMLKAAAEMGFTNNWKAAMAKVKLNFVPAGEQDELVTSIAREATDFVKEKQFATIPPLCEETWRMRMMSPETLKTIPYAAYAAPEMQVAYPRDDMKQEDKLMVMRGNNRHYTRLTVMHELIPGHHLQIFQAARNHEHRRLFATPFHVEGWAVYCELRLWDLGWPRSPEDKIGMLFWRMHRAARIITTVKFHIGKMAPDEMTAFLIDRIGHEKFGAMSEVRRFISEDTAPLYQAGYLLGARQLNDLHDELTGAGGMSERQFNDAVLKENSMPIEILRAALRDLPLAPDARPAWKFGKSLKR